MLCLKACRRSCGGITARPRSPHGGSEGGDAGASPSRGASLSARGLGAITSGIGRGACPANWPLPDGHCPAAARADRSIASRRRTNSNGIRRPDRGDLGMAAVKTRAASPADTMKRNALLGLLAARGWTDEMLAVRAGIARSHVNELKNGHIVPRVSTALRIAHVFNLPVAEVFPPGSSHRRPKRRTRTSTEPASHPRACRRS